MRAPLAWVVCLLAIAADTSCTRENPIFGASGETAGVDEELADEELLGDEDSPLETGDGGAACELVGGGDMVVSVPHTCGVNDPNLGAYRHWFRVVAAAGDTWSVQFCELDFCADVECKHIVGQLQISPLPLAQLAQEGACLEVTARGFEDPNDECNYHAISVSSVGEASSELIVLARRTELIELPPLATATGLADFEPELIDVESCSCAESPSSCCDANPTTVHAYQVGDVVIPIGENRDVTIQGRQFVFWTFNAFSPGDCDGGTDISWALTAK